MSSLNVIFSKYVSSLTFSSDTALAEAAEPCLCILRTTTSQLHQIFQLQLRLTWLPSLHQWLLATMDHPSLGHEMCVLDATKVSAFRWRLSLVFYYCFVICFCYCVLFTHFQMWMLIDFVFIPTHTAVYMAEKMMGGGYVSVFIFSIVSNCCTPSLTITITLHLFLSGLAQDDLLQL